MLDVAVSSPDYASVRAAAAMKGLLLDQKAVIAFRAEPGGKQLMARFEVDGTARETSAALKANGLTYHTVVAKGGSTEVWVFATDGKAEVGNVRSAAKAMGARGIRAWQGRGEFIGDNSDRPSRPRARSIYRKELDRFLAGGGESHRAEWNRAFDHWSAEIARVSKVKADLGVS